MIVKLIYSGLILKQHFPKTFVETITIGSETDCYVAFGKAYEHTYGPLSVPLRKIFSLIKENDLESLKTIEITRDMLSSKDVHGNAFNTC